MPGQQANIQEGDIYGAYLRTRSGSVPILVTLPASSDRRVYRDERSFAEVESSRELRRNQLTVQDVGMILQAVISK